MIPATIKPWGEPRDSQRKAEQAFVPPPSVITTPCDPWPRPYYIEDGLRKVHPYHFTYKTNCKERWRGRELLDIFATEFRDRSQAYYVRTYGFHYSYSLLTGFRKMLLSGVT